MSRFVSLSDTKTIRADWWDEGEEVIIRKYSYGDRQRLAGAAIGAGVDISNVDSPSIKMDFYEVTMLQLELGIQSWTFIDENNKPVPVKRRAINMLSDKDGKYIAEQIEAYNPDEFDVDEERLKKLEEQLNNVRAHKEKKAAGGEN